MAQITATQITFFILLSITIWANGDAAYVPLSFYTYPANTDYSTYPSPAYTPTISSTSSNILRTQGNLGQISTYHKSVQTPFSSVRKSDVRISNDALTIPATAVHVPVATPVHISTPVHVPAPLHVPVPVHAPVHAIPTAPLAITYSSAPAVAHFTFDGFGTHYDW